MSSKPLYWRLSLAFALAVITALSLLPLGPGAPTTGWDKTNHVLAFTLLAMLASRAWPARPGGALAALLAYGGLIELVQSLTGYRSAEWADWLADAIGLLLGWYLMRAARRATARLRTRP